MHATADLVRAKFDTDQFFRMGECGAFAGRNVMLFNGEILEMPAEGARHFAAVHLVMEVLRRCYGEGFFVRRPGPLPLSLETDPEPDVSVVRGTVRDYARRHPSSALLVVEVSETTLHYDRGFKRKLYAEGGIPEYWVLSLPDERLEVHSSVRGTGELAEYDRPLHFRRGHRVLPPGAVSDCDVSELLPD